MSLADLYSSQTVSIRTRTGRNNYGEPTYSTATSVPAHVRAETRVVRTAQGEEVVSVATVVFPASVDVGDGLLISVAGSRYHDVLRLDTIVDCFGQVQHYEALV